jgi:hypothetical protein
MNERTALSFGYFDPGIFVDAVITPLDLKPGSTASNWRKLAASNPAPINSTNAKAI